METPICEVCLKSSVLCGACEKKLSENNIQDIEIQVSRYLYNLSKKVSSLFDVKIIKIMDSERIIIITAEGDAAKVVGKAGLVVKLLAKEFNKPIKVIEEKKDMKEFIESVIKPVPISGINTVYIDGNSEYKIIIPSRQRNKLSVSLNDLSVLISKLYGCKVLFDVER
jgi:transcription antitermination factor NusA-like protein